MNGLFGSTVLEVAIGMAVLYLLLASFCTAANEWIARVMNARAATLEQALRELLSGQPGLAAGGAELVDEFYGHPLIGGLMKGGKHPSYLAARSFAGILMDLVTPEHPGTITFDQLEEGILKLPKGNLRRTLLALIQGVNRDLGAAQKAIEGWFNDAMERVSARYKRRTQMWTLVVASLITVAMNADTIHFAGRLWLEPALRSMAVAAAGHATLAASDAAVAQLGQMIGWQGAQDWSVVGWLERALGWLLTVGAVSLGAPFWFDTLNRFVNIRAEGRSPEEKAQAVAAATM
jgi:hypothetical protein